MAFARDVYTATGGQTDFTISYSYEDDDHIEVYQNGSLLTETTHYTFPDSTTCRLVTGATADDKIVLQRNTSQSTKLVDFTAGTLTETDLDNAMDQMFYMAQESIDQTDLALKKASDEIWDAGSTRIKNVATPTATTDAVTKAYADALAIADGNVVAPIDPDDDDKVLTASGGAWVWSAATNPTLHNIVATTAPTVTDDSDSGYAVRSMWMDVTNDEAWVCLDATVGAAVWKNLSADVGDLKMQAHSTTPSGWLACDGSAVSRTTYAALFAKVSTTWGVGDGSTTFNVPNFNGRSPIGVGQGNTADGGGAGTSRTLADEIGQETDLIAEANLPGHTHGTGTLVTNTTGAHTHTQYGGPTQDNCGSSGTDVQDYGTNSTGSAGNHSHTISGSTASTGGDTAFSLMHPALAVNFIIKY